MSRQIFVNLAVKNKDIYKTHAEKAAVVFKEHGALKLVEFGEMMCGSAKSHLSHFAVQSKPDESVIFSCKSAA